MTVQAATGHRPAKFGGYSDLLLSRLVRLAAAHMERYPPTEAISGMALGWDTAWAIAALNLGISLTAAVPCRGQDVAWRSAQRLMRANLLRRATRVVMVSDREYDFFVMQTRNEWMVDRCDELVALWDGSSGGTANCIRYARLRGKPVVNLWDEWIGTK